MKSTLGFPRLICATLFFLSAACFAQADAWPAYRHDQKRSARTSARVAPPLAQAWVYTPTAPPRTAWHPPAEEMPRSHDDNAFHAIIAENRVFFASSSDDAVRCLPLAGAPSGDITPWTFTAEGPVRFAPAYSEGRLYFGADDGYAYCLKAADGALVWKQRIGPSDERLLGNGRMISNWPVRVGVLVDSGVVYLAAGVFPYEGIQICALRAEDGSVVWKNDTIGDRSHDLMYGGVSPFGYLVASDTTLFVPSGRATPAAFDRATGKFLYYPETAGFQGGTWALLDRDQLIFGVDNRGQPAKAGVDVKTGVNSGYVYGWSPSLDMATSPEAVYSLTSNGIHAINRKKYAAASQQAEAIDLDISNLEKKQKELKKNVQKNQKKIDGNSEEILKLQGIKNQLKPSAYHWRYLSTDLAVLIQADETLFAGGRDKIVAVDTQTGKEVWKRELKGNVLGMSAAEGALVVSLDTGEIHCFVPGTRDKHILMRNRGDFDATDATDATEAAEEILKDYNAAAPDASRAGWCLLLDCGEGDLALGLAKQTDFNIVALESDPARLRIAREKLHRAGLYGTRAVVEPWPLETLPDYFANLIVLGDPIATGNTEYPAEQLFRTLKPCGGVAIFSRPKGSSPDALDRLVRHARTAEDLALRVARDDGSRAVVVRGPLPGAGAWTHLYGNAENTACSDDQLARGPFGVLWYGEPGPMGMVDRHARANAPVAGWGRLFIQGEEIVMAHDAYNGVELWKRAIPGAVRVRVDVDGGNLSLARDALYVATHEKCLRLDPATGKTVRTYKMPIAPDAKARWGYLTNHRGLVYGLAAEPLDQEYGAIWKKEETERRRTISPYTKDLSRLTDPDIVSRRQQHVDGLLWNRTADFPSWSSQASPKDALTSKLKGGDTLFALDADTGDRRWIHHGKRIANIAIAMDSLRPQARLFFLDDALDPDQRLEAQEERNNLIAQGVYKKSAEEELKPDERDQRLLTALDAQTGGILWEKPLDLTGCGGDKAGVSYAQGLILIFGHFSNHDGDLFRGGKLLWRRVTAISAETGRVVWSRPLNYLRRPLVVGDTIVVEPLACDLFTGEPRTRVHPITGLPVPWEFLRPGHCCAITAASLHALFFRSYWTAIYDLANDAGLTLFGGTRLGCWLNSVPANGLVMMPEASSGCICSFPIRTTIVMKNKPKIAPSPWSVFITHGDQTPVRRLGINLGAPGDIRDDNNLGHAKGLGVPGGLDTESGDLWFGYPRPKTVSNTGYGSYGVKFKLDESVLPGMGFSYIDHRDVTIAGASRPYLFTSGCVGLTSCSIPLIDPEKGEAPARYTVRLGFLAPAGDLEGGRVFSIALQGKTVESAFDITREAGGAERAIVRAYLGVDVKDNLKLKFEARAKNPTRDQAPVLNYIEVLREYTGAEKND